MRVLRDPPSSPGRGYQARGNPILATGGAIVELPVSGWRSAGGTRGPPSPCLNHQTPLLRAAGGLPAAACMTDEECCPWKVLSPSWRWSPYLCW